MNKRPLSVTVISVVFIVFGGVTLLASFLPPFDGASAQNNPEMKPHHPWGDALIDVVRAVPILCGVLMLYRFNGARWLLVVWIGFHIVIGFLHSAFAGLVHSASFGVILFYLFRPLASEYFRGLSTVPPQSPATDGTPPA